MILLKYRYIYNGKSFLKIQKYFRLYKIFLQKYTKTRIFIIDTKENTHEITKKAQCRFNTNTYVFQC